MAAMQSEQELGGPLLPRVMQPCGIGVPTATSQHGSMGIRFSAQHLRHNK